ncbi:hypothetical protein D621_01770 [beta proteobacterium AAP51]|nr:hypothetical protein D621_01770 [beta proteobacterium AAP51]
MLKLSWHAARACLLPAALLVLLSGCGGGKEAAPEASNTAPPELAAPTAPGMSPANPVPYTAGMDPHAQRFAVAATVDDGAAFMGCHAAGAPRRLTRRQLVQALSDITLQLSNDSALAAGVAPLVQETALFPPDTLVNPDSARHVGYERLDTTLSSRQLGALHTTAVTLATRMTADAARVAQLLGTCSGTAACLEAFVRKAGRLYFRQPLSTAEVALYVGAAGGATTGPALAKVLATMMASPKFYLVVERGQGQAEGRCRALSAHELAARLSLHFWDTVPDAALAAAADDGSLLRADVLQVQVARLVRDPRADGPLRRFFEHWWRLQELTALDGKVGNARFDAFAAGYRPLPGTRDAAITEVLDMVSHVAARNGSLQQLLTNRQSFARSSDLATLYQTPVWDGRSEPPLFAQPERVGLLTRVGMLAHGATDTTLPIQRGIRVLSALTCQTLPPPAMDQSNASADLSGVLTTRQRTERVTQMPGTSCVGCHQTSINPWGFVFEGFDALGRVRQREVVYDDSGRVRGERPLDTGVVAALSGLPPRAMATAAEAQQLVLESGHFERCFARNYVRYTFGRNDGSADAELVESLRRQAASGANLRSLMATVALRKEFTHILTVQP